MKFFKIENAVVFLVSSHCFISLFTFVMNPFFDDCHFLSEVEFCGVKQPTCSTEMVLVESGSKKTSSVCSENVPARMCVDHLEPFNSNFKT